MVEIDYSQIAQEPATKPSHWQAPRRVFFGGRNRDTGEPIPEPEYVHQEYPKLLYKKVGDKVTAILVKSEEEMRAKGKEWATPLKDLVITCPSFDQITPEMHAATQAEIRRVADEGRKK